MDFLELNNAKLMERLPQTVKVNMGEMVTGLKFVGGGSYGRVFKGTLPKSGEKIILKAYRRKGLQNEEAEQLETLRRHTSVKMPEVYFTHEDEETAVLAMSFIDGENAMNPKFILKSKERKSDFAFQVIDGMLGWHSVKNNRYGFLKNCESGSWKTFYLEGFFEPRMEGLKALCRDGKYPEKDLERLLTGAEIFKKEVAEPECPVLIHGDLNIMNIMVDPKTMRVNGFIDPLDSMWADREYDLFQLRNMWGDKFGLFDEYKRRVKLSDDVEFKLAFYGAVNEASCRLRSGASIHFFEKLWNDRLEKAIKTYR
ncbi:MAG: phosphotransferase [Oscillospiraceae bacterium]|nr:phosphotransferase [Oscillospiraceae bacterium]